MHPPPGLGPRENPGLSAQMCLFQMVHALVFFLVSNPMLFGIHSPFLLQVFLQKIRSWWQQPQLPRVHTPNLLEQTMEDESASTSEMHALEWCTVVERTIFPLILVSQAWSVIVWHELIRCEHTQLLVALGMAVEKSLNMHNIPEI